MTDSSSSNVRRVLPRRPEIHSVNQSFTFYERIGLFLLLAISICSFLIFLWKANSYALVEIPASGGTLVEGIVGAPRFINPILAISDADRDLVSLVYSGLMRVSADGSLVPDLAEKYVISEDGKQYTFTLRTDIYWHDGEPITSRDVIYTITTAVDPSIKSPRRANWEGVSVTADDHRTITFTLKQPYAAFLENTTMGIIPEHKWRAFDAESFPFSPLNTDPIGSGPYRISKIKHNDSGLPEWYELDPFEQVSRETAKIKLRIRFFSKTEDLLRALSSGDIESASALSPEDTRTLKERGFQITQAPLPRVFGVFFNQNQAPIFTHQEVREALSLAAPRHTIVEQVLGGYAEPIDGPFPPGSLGYIEREVPQADIARAKELLESTGWKIGSDGIRVKKTTNGTEVLSFTLETSNVPELKRSAEILKSAWAELGVAVSPHYYEEGDLKNLVIRPRKYEALLFGEVVGRNSDPFSFWHSSQRLDPGLNVALYTNADADTLLTEARALVDTAAREQKLIAFQEEIRTDTPAVFLYAPSFIYVLPDDIFGISIPPITVGSDRFSSVHSWYMRTDKVWKIFANYYQ